MENIYAKRRKNCIDNFIKNGLDGCSPEEVLELLLWFAVTQHDTKKIACELMEKYGSLSEISRASEKELKRINGMTDGAVILLKLIPRIINRYSDERMKVGRMDDIGNIKAFFSAAFLSTDREQVKVCCLDENLRMISLVTAVNGTVSSAPMNVRKIVGAAFECNASLVIIAHNHPNGSAEPSDSDVLITRQLIKVLDSVGIKLLDHIIVGRNDTVSMKDKGYFNVLR